MKAIPCVSLYITPSHYHHCANLSEDIELIKCLSDIFCRVCKIRHILSVIHYTIRGAVCFQFTHFPCNDWENICTLSYYHHQIGRMNCYPLFRVRSLNNDVRCMSFLWAPFQYQGCLSRWKDCQYNDLYNGIFYSRKTWIFVLTQTLMYSGLRQVGVCFNSRIRFTWM